MHAKRLDQDAIALHLVFVAIDFANRVQGLEYGDIAQVHRDLILDAGMHHHAVAGAGYNRHEHLACGRVVDRQIESRFDGSTVYFRHFHCERGQQRTANVFGLGIRLPLARGIGHFLLGAIVSPVSGRDRRARAQQTQQEHGDNRSQGITCHFHFFIPEWPGF